MTEGGVGITVGPCGLFILVCQPVRGGASYVCLFKFQAALCCIRFFGHCISPCFGLCFGLYFRLTLALQPGTVSGAQENFQRHVFLG